MRPNALILCYPVISFTVFPHMGSGKNLLGERFEECRERYSLEKRVSEKTPPAFLWHTAEDQTVPWQNSVLMAEALYEKKIPCSLREKSFRLWKHWLTKVRVVCWSLAIC